MMNTKTKILIVDDNIPFCKNLVEILELKGYQSAYVNDGFKALEALKNNDYHLILLDIKMPLMNGVKTFRKIRKIKPEIPVIMITAYALEDLIKEALQDGIFGILYKPLNMEKLHSTIESAMPDGALVLVVDDDPEINANLSEILGKKGYQVKTAEDGKSAIQMTRETEFDILLLDMKLPFLDGLETYLAIQEIRPGLITIIISGYLREMGIPIQEALERGAYACFEKPFDIDHLLKLLKKVEKLKSVGSIGKIGNNIKKD